MKTIFKHLFFIAVLFSFYNNTLADGPQGDDAKIKAFAQVVAFIEVAGQNNLVFGNVTPGNDKSVSSTGAVTQGISTGGEQAGRFYVTKGSNTEVLVDFSLPSVLINQTGSGEEELEITFSSVDARFSTDESDQANGANHISFNPDEVQTLENDGATAAYFTASEFRVYIGGTVKPNIDQVAGDYETDIDLTVTYN